MEDLAMTLMRTFNRPTVPSFFDRIFEGDWMDFNNSNFSTTNTSLPAVNVKEDDNEFMIEVAAPGMRKDDFKVHLDNGRLTISSERKEEKTEGEKDNYTRKEFSYQSFQRTFNVPAEVVDGDKIHAKYADGILHISLPKREEIKPKPAKQIAIS